MLFTRAITDRFIRFNDIRFLIKYFYRSGIGHYGFGPKKSEMITSFPRSEESHSSEIKQIEVFRPEKFYLTDAQWCPGRPAVFISSTTEGIDCLFTYPRKDLFYIGSIHIWDLLFKQNEPTLTIKVKAFIDSSSLLIEFLQLSEEAITCLTFQDQGRYLACGTKDGNVILTELSDSLCIPDRNEKQLVSTVNRFDY